MIVQMSYKSEIYHRDKCGHISGILKENICVYDIEDEKISRCRPCKHCCKLKNIYKNYDYKKIFNKSGLNSELYEGSIRIKTKHYDWRIGLKNSSQKFKLYNAIWNSEYENFTIIPNDDIKSVYEIKKIIVKICNEEWLAEYHKAYRKYVGAIKRYAALHNMELEFEGSDLYILTDIAAWKIAYGEYTGRYKLLHSPFDEKKLNMEEAKRAYYHVQRDVDIKQTPYKHICYIYKHDNAKKIAQGDYRKLPQNSQIQKLYYKKAKNREYKRSIKRVMNIFAVLEAENDIKKYSIS